MKNIVLLLFCSSASICFADQASITLEQVEAAIQACNDKSLPNSPVFSFKKLFSDELRRLEIFMMRDDLRAGAGIDPSPSSQIAQMVEILTGLQKGNLKPMNIFEFPKLTLLFSNGLGQCSSDLNLNSFVTAFNKWQATGFYFWVPELERPLSGGEINHIQNNFSSTLSILSKLIREFEMDGLDGRSENRLYEAIFDVLRDGAKFVLPILYLNCPSGSNFRSSSESLLCLIKYRDPASLMALAERVRDTAEQLIEMMYMIPLQTNEWTDIVILRIPKPGLQVSDERYPMVPSISEKRAKAFWDHLFAKERVQEDDALNIEFVDLYQDAVQGRLSLICQLPVIKDMALLFRMSQESELRHSEILSTILTIDMRLGEEQLFPLRKGPKKLRLVNEVLRSHYISVGFSEHDDYLRQGIDLLNSFVSKNLKTAHGLSPFTTFRFADMNTHPMKFIREVFGADKEDYPEGITDIYLMMKMSVKSAASMEWLKRKLDQ